MNDRSDRQTSFSNPTVVSAVVISLIVGLAIGGLAGVKWRRSHADDENRANVAGQKQLWTCGMHPQVIQDKPGNCPICGMALEPLNVSGAAGTDGAPGHDHRGIQIDPVVVQNMGVRVAEVTRGPLRRTIRAVGVLEEAQPNIRDVNLRVSGWIERLYADTEGDHVTRHQPLFELYSPEVQVAVEELIVARRASETMPQDGDPSTRKTTHRLYDAARRKLEQWGLEQEQIERLSKLESAPRMVQFASPVSGHIVEKTIVEGASVQAGARVFRIVDHSTLWLDVQVHAQDQPFIRIGQRAVATIEAAPAEEFAGRIMFVHPHVDPMTRTARARIAVNNWDMTLKPGMFATARVEAELKPEALLAPREAVIDTGQRKVVFVALDDGRFEPRDVNVGSGSDDGFVEVIEGLDAGERVVTSGQFLLDSESRMREAIQKHLEKQLLAKAAPATAPSTDTGSARWRQAVDAVVREYLAIAQTLGEVQTSDTPIDPAKLPAAARTLLDRAESDSQKSAAKTLVEAVERLGGHPLDHQRGMFKAVSEAAIALVRISTPSPDVGTQKLYIWHCPMAPGAWLQTSEKPANPYYATSMKQCAELKQTIATTK
jgi:RND family efflux transporter MFP subunit